MVGRKTNDKNLEQRINIKFYVNIGKSASETLALLTVAYGEYTMKKSSVFEWHRQFKEGREDVQDDPRSGQPKTQRTDTNVDRVRTLLHSDRRLGVRVIAEELTMNRETVQQIEKEYLGMRKISAKMVPRILTHDQGRINLFGAPRQ
jgi:transposase